MSREDRWQGRPWVAFVIRALVFLVPIALSVGSAFALQRIIPKPPTWQGAVLWWVGIAAVSTLVLWTADKAARRALPLAALFKLSLVFPDQAPSRYKIARKSGNLRDLESELDLAREQGLAGDRTAAAETILKLVAHLSEHDRATRGHSERVRVFTDMLADELDLDEEQRDRLRWAALLHDVGKLTVHTDILNKPGKPTEEEWTQLKHHPVAGAEITKPLHDWLGEWALAVEQHHEKYDGSGYPGGLSGTSISWGARIVAVGDAYDTMTAARAYKKPMSAVDARRELATCAGSHFDPVVVRAFLSISLGRLRLAMGPLSWLAQGGPLASVGSRAVEGLATGAAALGAAAAVVAPSMIEKPPVAPEPAVIAAPSETPAPSLPPLAEPSPAPEATEPTAPAPEPTVAPDQPAPQPTTTVVPVEQPQPEPDGPAPTPPPPTAPSPAPTTPPVGPPAPTPVPTPEPAPVVVPIATIAAAPGDGARVAPGDTVAVTIRVTMPADATGPTSSTLTIPLPTGAALVPGTLRVDGSTVAGPDPMASAITLPDLEPGATVVVTYTLVIPEGTADGTVVVPTAQVRTTATTVSAGLGSGLVVRLPLAPRLTASASPTEVTPGGTVDLTATVTNPGPGVADAGDLVATASLGPELSLVAGTTRVGGVSSSGNPLAGVVLPRLGPGESITIAFRARVSATATPATPITARFRVTGERVASPPSATVTMTVPATTDVTVTATPTPSNGSQVRPGETITLGYVVSNGSAANSAATGRTLRVPVPAGTTYVAGSARADGTAVASGATANPWESARAVPSLAPGASHVITFQVTVDAGASDGDVLVSAAQLAGGSATKAASASWTVDAGIDFSLTTSAQPPAGPVVPGDRVDFTARITNATTSTVDAPGVEITATVPGGMTYVTGSAEVDGAPVEPASATSPYADGHVLGTIVPGQTVTVTWSARVDAPADDGTALASVVTVTDTGPAPTLTERITHTVTSSTAPSLLLTAPAGIVATPGQTVPLRIDVTNGASATAVARGIVLTDVLPAGTSYEPGSALDGSGSSIEPSAGADPFAGAGFTVPDLAPGDTATYTFAVRIDRPLKDRTVLPVVIDATGSDGSLSSDLDLVVSSAPTTAVTLTVDATDPVVPGQRLTYTLTASNDAAATASATGVTVRIPTAAELRYVEDSATRRDGSSIISTTNPYATAQSIGDLLPGQSASVSLGFVVQRPIADATPITVEATVDTVQTAPVTRSVTRTVDSDPQLVATPSSATERTVVPGEIVTVSWTFENRPAAGATASSGTVTIPTVAGLRYIPNSAKVDGSVRSGPTNPFADGEVVGALPPGSSTQVEAQFEILSPQDDGTRFSIPATLVTAEQSVSADEVLVVASGPLVTVTRTATPDTANLVSPGTEITYVFEVTNAASATESARDVRITGGLPQGPSGGADAVLVPPADPATFPWSGALIAAELAPGETATATFTARVLDGAPGILQQESTITWAQDTTGTRIVTQHTRDSAPVLDVSIASTPTEATAVAPGDTISYTATIENVGDAPATNVEVTWPTPTGTTATSNPYDPGPIAVAATLAAGDRTTVSLTVEVEGPYPPSSTIDSRVTVDADELGAPEAAAAGHAVAEPNLSVATEILSATAGEVVPGETVTIRTTVFNSSASVDATAVDVMVPTPAGMTYAGNPTEDGTPIASATNPFSPFRLTTPLAAGETTVLEYEATVNRPMADGTLLTATSDVDAFEVTGTASDTTSVTVRSAPTLSITTVATPASGTTVAPMQAIDYVVTVVNDSSAADAARGVTFTLPTPSNASYSTDSASVRLPDGTAVVVADAPATGDNPFQSGYQLSQDLAPGQYAEARFQVIVSGPTSATVDLAGSVSVDPPGTGGSATSTHTIGGSPAAGLVISEFRFEGQTGDDEFIELYNPTSSAIDISGVTLRFSSEAGEDLGVLVTVPGGTTLPGYHHYLIVNQDGFSYPGEPGGFGEDERIAFADLAYAGDIDQYGGVQLRDAFDEVLDEVGIRGRPPSIVGSPFTEGAGLPVLAKDTSGSYERRHGGTAGNCIDSDRNEDDFRHVLDPADVIYSRLVDGPIPCGTPAGPLPASAGSVVISQFRSDGPATDGLGGGSDEFIELFNALDRTVSLEGWVLRNQGPVAFTFGPSATLAPGQYLLLGGARDSRDRYTAPNPADPTMVPDAWYGSGAAATQPLGTPGGETLKNNGLIRLLDAAGNVRDAVSVGDNGGEGRKLPSLEGRTDQSYERLNGGSLGSCVDTGDNLADFRHLFEARPRNRTAPFAPCPPQPGPAAASDLSMTLSPNAGPYVVVASPVSYTVDIVNGRSVPATGMVLTYTADRVAGASATLITATTTTPVSMASLAAGYPLPDLAAGASQQVIVSGTVELGLADDPVVNEATLTASQLAGPMEDISFQWQGLRPALDVQIAADPPNGGRLLPGQVVSYTATVRNAGATTANAVELDLTLPPGLVYLPGSAVDASGTPISGPSNPFVGYAMAPLAVGESRVVSLKAEVLPGTAAGTVLQLRGELQTSGLNDAEVAYSRHVVRTASGAATGPGAWPWGEGLHLVLAGLAVAWFELRRTRRDLKPVLVALPRRPGLADRRRTPRS